MKALAIAFKEILIVVRDRTAFWLRLAAPLALTAVMGFAFSRVNQGNGLSQINVVMVNQDSGSLGQALTELLGSQDLRGLLAVTYSADPAAARAQVDADKAAAAIIVPADFSAQALSESGGPARVEVYGNPGRAVSAGVVRDIAERYAQQVSAGVVGAQVTVQQLVESGRLAAVQASAAGAEIGPRVAQSAAQRQLVAISTTGPSQGGVAFDYLAYYAPGMATLFLMLAMMSSARTLLAEREAGTFDRLRAAPLSAAELLGGKVLGVFAVGALQMAALILATHFFMGIAWGNPIAVTALTLMVVAAVASLGLVVATLARTAGQASAIGSTVTMVLAAVGGNFVPRMAFPAWLKSVSAIGPNSWALDGYQAIAAGAKLSDVTPQLAALALMTAVFFGVALWGLRRIVK
jgi:ABC-2 type transport system permease protein